MFCHEVVYGPVDTVEEQIMLHKVVRAGSLVQHVGGVCWGS